MSFEPLAVFFSTQMTLWYCGDDDAGRGRFPRIRCTERLGRMVGDREEKKLIVIPISGYLMCIMWQISIRGSSSTIHPSSQKG